MAETTQHNMPEAYTIMDIIPPYIEMLDFHWIKAMLSFRKYF